MKCNGNEKMRETLVEKHVNLANDQHIFPQLNKKIARIVSQSMLVLIYISISFVADASCMDLQAIEYKH